MKKPVRLLVGAARSCSVALLLLVLSAPLVSTGLAAEAPGLLDKISFGDAGSETNHAFAGDHSEIISGGLGEPARRLLPLDPVSYDGGLVSFKLKVDPLRQNYLTVKLWGSDKSAASGRLILYLDGMQVGYRHEGEYDVLNQTDDEAVFQGRFLYQTVALPLQRTQGRTEVELKIAGLGPMWAYGNTFEKYQHNLTEPTRGIYRAYTHTNTRFEPDASEQQGAAVTPSVRPGGPGEELLTQMKETVNGRLGQLLKDKSGDAANGQNKMLLLAEAYETPWTLAYHNDLVIPAIIREGDAYARNANLDPENWVGAGPFGEAIAKIGHNPQSEKALDEPVEVPAQPAGDRRDRNQQGTNLVAPAATVKLPRRAAWARVLRASVDGHRTKGRRFYTNQSMILDYNIYAANRGLMVLEPAQALTEQQALRYLYEAVGLLPWSGNDTGDGGSEKPYGTNYFEITHKGLSRELGYVGTYGETILKFMRDMVALSGDEKIRQQLIKIQAARMNFRYPSLDADGCRTMKLASEIDNRTAHFPLPDGAYTSPDIREAWWMEVPALTKDAVSVGAAQQCLEDNQYFYRLAQRAKDNDTLGMMRNIDEYATVKAQSKSSFRLPMTDGQPDFVFSDEEDAVLALKHGQQRLFVNFYYRQEFGVSGSTRILDLTPAVMRIATVKSQFEVTPSGREWMRPDVMDTERTGGLPPPGPKIHQAWQGEKVPVAKRPDDATAPRYGAWGPFVGKADFYTLRYGDYLIGLNTTADKTFELNPPVKIAGAKDLVSGKTIKLNAPVKVAPRSTVILFLGK